MEFYTQFQKVVDPIGDDILAWFVQADVQGFRHSYPRPTKDWPLASFSSALAIAIAYLAFVFVGRIVMSVLNPLDKLTYPVRFTYNLAQMMLCSYMTIEAFALAYRNNYKIEPCNPFDTKSPPVGPLLWLFYISKILDFVDTIVIVLGKKWAQLSFLHIYHHTTIFLFYWVNTNVGYDGDIYLTIVLNGLIHTVMYTYYFVSMHAKDIWWKKYLTLMQMVQFMCMMTQGAMLYFGECKTFPARVTLVYLGYIFSLFLLFLNFFISSYMPKKGGKRTKRD